MRRLVWHTSFRRAFKRRTHSNPRLRQRVMAVRLGNLGDRDSTRGPEKMKQEFYVLIEQDEDGVLIGEVPQLRGCYTQGRTLDELLENIREVILLCLEDQPHPEEPLEFVGVQKVTV